MRSGQWHSYKVCVKEELQPRAYQNHLCSLSMALEVLAGSHLQNIVLVDILVIYHPVSRLRLAEFKGGQKTSQVNQR